VKSQNHDELFGFLSNLERSAFKSGREIRCEGRDSRGYALEKRERERERERAHAPWAVGIRIGVTAMSLVPRDARYGAEEGAVGRDR
jgi:hypothetical protein